MLGLDTNIVLRLLTGVPKAQADCVHAFLQTAVARGDTLGVSDLVIAEAFYAMIAHYGVTRDEARDALIAMFDTGLVSAVGVGEAVLRESREAPSQPGLIDRVIHRQYAGMVPPARMVTFDKACQRLPRTVVLEV